MDGVIQLLSTTYEKNAYGVDVPTETSRQVFCRVDSVTRAEFFNGGRSGLNPSWVFTLPAANYLGEDTVIYNGKPYGVYRTYYAEDIDEMELYVERKGGTNGKQP